MARKARQKKLYSIYYLTQQCNSLELFNTQRNREVFINSLVEAQLQYQFITIAASLNGDHYQLIIFDNGTDISKIMKSINISFALNLSNHHIKMTNRYKSIIIEDINQLTTYLDDIGQCADFLNDKMIVGNSKINTSRLFKHYFDSRDQFIEIIEHDNSQLCCIDESCHRIMICNDDCIRSISAANDYIDDALRANSLSRESLLEHKQIRNQLIIDLRRRSTLSLKQIGQLFGDISESAISKIIKRYHENKEDTHEFHI